MIRTAPVLALALVCTLASPALAKDLCLQLDTGLYAGSHVVLKDVNLGAQKFGPVHGYLARFGVSSFIQFYPTEGQAMVSSTHNLLLGLMVHEGVLNPDGSADIGFDAFFMNLRCPPGTDGKINVLDTCDGFVSGAGATGHIIDCHSAPRIP